MRTCIFVAALFAPLVATAAPFIITDPVDPNADVCVYQVGAAVPQLFPVVLENGQRVCKIDLANAAPGTNNITLKVRNSLWGVESATVPFVFTKPESLAVPANTRLVP